MRQLAVYLSLSLSLSAPAAFGLDRAMVCQSNVKRISFDTEADPNLADSYTIYSCADGWHFNLKDGRVVVVKKTKTASGDEKFVSCVRTLATGQEQCCPSGNFNNNLTADKAGDSVSTQRSIQCYQKPSDRSQPDDVVWITGKDPSVKFSIGGSLLTGSGNSGQKQSAMNIHEEDTNTAGGIAGAGNSHEGDLNLNDKIAQSSLSGLACDQAIDSVVQSGTKGGMQGTDCPIKDLRKKEIDSDNGQNGNGAFNGLVDNSSSSGQSTPLQADTSGLVPTSR